MTSRRTGAATPHDDVGVNRRMVALRVLLWLLAAGILAQAVLAGLFISGVADARFAHLIVGSLLPYLALIPAVLGGVCWAGRSVSWAVGLGSVTLPVVVWAQSALGHMPFPVSTAVHVPLGTMLLTHAMLLAWSVRTRPLDATAAATATPGASPPPPQPPTWQ